MSLKDEAFYMCSSIINISKVVTLSHVSSLSSGKGDICIHLLCVTSSLLDHSGLYATFLSNASPNGISNSADICLSYLVVWFYKKIIPMLNLKPVQQT